MKKSFEIELVINGCTKVFADGFAPGGFSKQTVTFEVDEREVDSPLFLAVVYDEGKKFLESQVSVNIREVQEQDKEKKQ